jgi:hypothetical protein
MRTDTSTSTPSLSATAIDYVRHNTTIIAQLPPAGDQWTVAEIRQRDAPSPSHFTLPHWEQAGVVNRVGTRTFDDGNDRAVWTVTAAAYSRARSLYEDSSRLDCCTSATGFRNLGDGRFTCSNDECDVIHSRERIKEVFG